MKIKNNKLNIIIIASAIILVIISGIVYLVLSKGSIINKLQDKPAGLLSLNTDQAQYTLGEKVHIQITSLDNLGNTLCDSNLTLSITQIGGNDTVEQPAVTNSPSCDPSNSTSLNSDYFAYFTPPSEGEYQIKVTDLDNNDTGEIQVIVGTGLPDFSITRWGATRIDPAKTDRSPMKFTIVANKDFAGELIEQVPPHIDIIWQGPAKVEKTESGQSLTWEIDIKAGEKMELAYEYVVPSDSKDNFTLGTAKLISEGKTVFEETRPWNITVNHE